MAQASMCSLPPAKRRRTVGYERDRADFWGLINDKGILANLPAIENDEELEAGVYLIVGMRGKPFGSVRNAFYFLDDTTRCIQCAIPGDTLNKIMKEGSIEHMIEKMNWFPQIHVQENDCISVVNSFHLEKTAFKELDKWKVQDCFPFSFCRLIEKGVPPSEEEESDEEEDDDDDDDDEVEYVSRDDVRRCDEKIGLFKHGIFNNPKYAFDGKSRDVYIIGLHLTRSGMWGSTKETILVVESFDPQDEKTLIHEMRIMKNSNENRELFKLLDKQADVGYLTYNKILYGDYVIKAVWDADNKCIDEDEELTIIKLSKAPFHRKKLENNVFV